MREALTLIVVWLFKKIMMSEMEKICILFPGKWLLTISVMTILHNPSFPPLKYKYISRLNIHGNYTPFPRGSRALSALF